MKPIAVKIQANIKKEYWDNVPKVQHVFKTDYELATFAYRLAMQLDCEVRVSDGGSGRYFNPHEADQFLSN